MVEFCSRVLSRQGGVLRADYAGRRGRTENLAFSVSVGVADSDLRRQILEPTMGLEPTTPALQERCATNCAKSA